MKKLNENEKIIAKNVLAAFVVKGGSLIISMLSTPLFVRFFSEDKEILGIWYTLLSILTWFMTFDLGIGNGIRNRLVTAFADKNHVEAKKIVSSGIFSNVAVTIVLTAIGLLLLNILDLNQVLNISSETISGDVLRSSALVVFVAIMLRFLLSVVSAVFYAIQKSFVNNLLTLMSSVLQLLFVLLFKIDDPEKALFYLSVGYLVTSNLPAIIAGVIVFSSSLRQCSPSIRFVDKQHIHGVMGVGSVFFACQIMYMLMMNTNEVIISNLFSPEYTTDYTFYFKITSLISTVLTLAMTPIWSVVTKAIAEKNYAWTKKLYGFLKLIGLGAVVLEFLLIPFLQTIMDIWLGDNSIAVNYGTALAFACFSSVFIYTGILSTVVCGMARMRIQTISYSVAMVVRFILIFIFAQHGGNWDVVVWSTVLVLLPYCIIQHIDLNIYFNKKIKEGQFQ
ncbi:MAG: oligosaccharide flippase family protein [Clostridia bacterium]|nr:oligosaccharide flippase family protein [Clostridia bacterium]